MIPTLKEKLNLGQRGQNIYKHLKWQGFKIKKKIIVRLQYRLTLHSPLKIA